MDADRLFIGRCHQLAGLMKSHDELRLLDLSALLRQLLVDDYPLIHKANFQRGLKLTFKVGEFRLAPDQYTEFLSLEDGLDPDTRPRGSPSKEVDVAGLLRHEILFIRGKPHSVQDAIKYAANVAGGVHHTSNPKERQKLIAEYSSIFVIGGLPAGIRQLQAIARVFLKGASSLISAIEST